MKRFNELRLTDFNEEGGWAARGRATVRLADLGTVQASGQYSSVGFGSIDQSVTERSMSESCRLALAATWRSRSRSMVLSGRSLAASR